MFIKADNATNPNQYDSPEINWQLLGAEGARKYFRDELDFFIEPHSLKDKRVLDIGSGVGHLFGWLKDKGVSSVTGIDPSSKNIEYSKEKYPWARSIVSTFEDFAKSKERFDVAIAILVFEHIQDLNSAFHDVNNILETGGKFYLIIGDKNYHLSNDKNIRANHHISAEIIKELGDGAVETKTIRDLGNDIQSVMYDIFRPIGKVREAAKINGFKLINEKMLMTPTSVSVPMLYILDFLKTKS